MNGAGPASPVGDRGAVPQYPRRPRGPGDARRDPRRRLAASPTTPSTCETSDAFGALIDALRARTAASTASSTARASSRTSSSATRRRSRSTASSRPRWPARRVLARSSPTTRASSSSSRASPAPSATAGQTDYAAANDALDKLAHHLHRTVRARVLSINWGPWRGVGMVRPELEREYERRGIGLIAPDAGIERFFEELLSRERSAGHPHRRVRRGLAVSMR